MKIMFGYPAYFINNNMFIAIFQEDLILRLSLEEKKKVMEEYNEISFFEPIPGRIMKEYIRIPESIYSNNEKFLKLLKKSIGYVSKLSTKEKK